MTQNGHMGLQWSSPAGYAFGGRRVPGALRLLLRLFEISQIGRCLILLCRHQEAIRAQEVVFLANDNIHVALIAVLFHPDRMRIGISLKGLVDTPWPRQSVIEDRDFVMEDVWIALVEMKPLFESRLIVEVQWQPT